MGAIGGLLGVGGGASGSGFAGPTASPIVNGTNAGQIGTAYGNAQGSLQSQQALLAALQGQNGIGNQSQVYGQLQGVANGTGPNPAQAMLNQSTGQNVANQAALAAGQRGASSNVGLIARQAAQQGSAAQQQAAGQAATLQANQSLNALNSAGQIAGTQAQNQIGATTAATQAQLAEQQQLQQALQSQNQLGVQQQGGINTINAGLANTTMQGQQGLIGGVLGGIGGGLASAGGSSGAGAMPAGAASNGTVNPQLATAGFEAEGGMIQRYDAGGVVGPSAPPTQPISGPQSSFGQFLKGWTNSTNPTQTAPSGGPISLPGNAGAMQRGASSMSSGIMKAAPLVAGAEGGKVPAMVSPGEKFLKPKDVEKVKKGANPMKVGETIPGKPRVSGAKNSYANDTVPKKLDEGGIVLPRSVTQSDNPYRDAIRFVQATLAKKRSAAK